MTRNLSNTVKTHLATNEIKPVHLIELGFDTPQYITDCIFNLTSSVSGTSRTYTSSSFILNVPSFTEETDITKNSLSIVLSGANQTYISLVLLENIVNDPINIYRAFLDSSNTIIADPFLLYKGKIDTYSITEDLKTSQINLTCVSHWADFDKRSGRKTNNTSQQRFFSTDVGMDFSSQNVLDIKWGRP